MSQTSAAPQAAATDKDTASDEKFASLLYICEDTRHWIIQADTKASFLLTINGVVAGFMVPQGLSLFALWKKHGGSSWALWLVLGVLLVYVVSQVAALWHTTLVFVPRKSLSNEGPNTTSRHVFNLSLVQHFPRLEDGDRLREEYHTLSTQDLEHEYLVRLQTDSLVCSAKYSSFLKAFHITLITLSLAAAEFLGILLLTAM